MKHVLAALALFAFPLATAAAEDQRCVDLVKECFAYSSPERDTCFKTAGNHPFCAGSTLGKLATKRAGVSLVVPGSEDQGPAFLGPQLVNSQCLSNFDNSWSAAMINGPISNETLGSLSAKLDRCSQVPASEVVRP